MTTTNFFKKLVKKNENTNNTDSNTNLSPKNSKSSATRSRSNSVTRRSSIRSKRSNSRSSKYLDDSESSLYNDDEGDTNTMMEFSEDDSSLSSQSILNKSKSNNVPNLSHKTTFDNHEVDEKITFPNLEDTRFDDVNLEQDEELPWVGLTYESFLTPKYVKISRRNKQSPKVLNNLFLAQELNINDNEVNSALNDSDERSDDSNINHDINKEIFVMEFSKDGKYLATAGRDAVIRVWKVISSPLGRLEYNQQDRNLLFTSPLTTPHKSNKRDEVFESAPVFHRHPVKEFRGHTRSILSLSWSKNNFLISGSMDKTVKLWHVDRDSYLKSFHNEDFVTSVKFHPLDDRFFLSGSLDNELRLWSVLENSVAFRKNLGEEILITAVEFTPDGVYCFVGGFNGSLFCVETKGLHIVHRVEIKSKSLAHPFHDKNGNKITGIKLFENKEFIPTQNSTDFEKWTILITTNDSKVRTFRTGKTKLITRFTGLTNNSSSIVASSDPENKYIISGSEDHYCYVWENNNNIINNRLKQSIKDIVTDGKHHINDFHHKHEKYTKILQSNKLQRLLKDDHQGYDIVANENNSYSCFHAHHSRCNVAMFAPQTTRHLLTLSDDIIYDLYKRGVACKMNPNCFNSEGSNKGNELSQSGEIIITTDQSGLIRVFRQDCAAEYRKKFVEFYTRGLNNEALTPTETVKSKRLCERSASPTRGGHESKNIKNLLSSRLSSSRVMSSDSVPTTATKTSNIFMQPDISLDVEDHNGFNHNLSQMSRNNSSQQTLNVVPNEHARKIDTHNEFFPPIQSPNTPKIVLPYSEIEKDV